MNGDLNRIFNSLITAVMLVLVLIACERMPEDRGDSPVLNIQSSDEVKN